MEYIITSGGTREWIDEVRFIGNRSTGRLGAAIADAAHDMGHDVTYIHAEGCASPRCAKRIREVPYVTSGDLKERLMEAVTKASAGAVVMHAAAVADYLTERSRGKIRSDRDELVLVLKRAEKLVDRIKTWNPGVTLVKFKLESGRTREELVRIAREAGSASRADWVVANDTTEISDTRHRALILGPDGNVIDVEGRREIAERLVHETQRGEQRGADVRAPDPGGSGG